MTIRVKLGLLVSGLVAATVGMAGAIQYYSERNARLIEGEAMIEATAVRLAAVADEALPTGELAALSAAMQAATKTEHAVFAALVRADSKNLWRESRDGYAEPLNEEGVRAALATGRPARAEFASGGRPALEWALPLKAKSEGATGTFGTRPLGVVLRVGFDLADARAAAVAAAAPALKRLVFAALASIVLGLLGATWLSASFTRTIKKLMLGAQEVGAGHFSARVQTRRGDELGDLSNEFNEMGHRLGELERLKDSFLAKITHDLRSPLAAITCYADVMQMGVHGPVTEKQINSLKLIVQSGNELAELVNNILDITKLEAGKMSFQQSEVFLKPAAQAVVDLLQIKAAEYGVQLDAASLSDETKIWVDEQALNRLLSNLLTNSLKFTPKGGKVSVHWQRSESGGDLIAVKDTGIGIPQDKIPTLFQKFSQIEETMHKVRFARGTGLGLVICREIAEGHGGRIWVESEYQRGSTFWVELPKPSASAIAAAARITTQRGAQPA